jgi:hypothetical protein
LITRSLKLSDDAIVENLVDLDFADFRIVAHGKVDERLPAFGDGVGDLAPDLEGDVE